MVRLKKPKVLMKCECGQTVAIGSVFCLCCKDDIQKRNAMMISLEERKYQQQVGSKGKKK